MFAFVSPRIVCIVLNTFLLVFLSYLIYVFSKLLIFSHDIEIYFDEFQDYIQNQFNQGKVDENYNRQIQLLIPYAKIGLPLIIIVGLVLIVIKLILTALLMAAIYFDKHILVLPWIIFSGLSIGLKSLVFLALVVLIAIMVNAVAFAIFGFFGALFLGIAYFYLYVVWLCYRDIKVKSLEKAC